MSHNVTNWIGKSSKPLQNRQLREINMWRKREMNWEGEYKKGEKKKWMGIGRRRNNVICLRLAKNVPDITILTKFVMSEKAWPVYRPFSPIRAKLGTQDTLCLYVSANSPSSEWTCLFYCPSGGENPVKIPQFWQNSEIGGGAPVAVPPFADQAEIWHVKGDQCIHPSYQILQ